MKMNQRMRPGFTLVELLVVIVIIAALAGLTAPAVIKFRTRGDLAEATNNARQLGIFFMTFDTDIGGYPDDSTIEAIEDITGEASARVLKGEQSNPYFRQLIEAGITKSEQPFFAKTSYSKRPPDDIVKGSEALKKGEVGFGYIMREPGMAISAGATLPLCATPLKPGSTDGQMEDPYGGKAIVLFSDNSVRQLDIRPNSSKAILPGGNEVLKGGSDETIWGPDINPIILPPEAR